MKLKGVIFEDWINYKKCSMVLEFPYCDFKCNRDCGMEVCHNYHLKDYELIDIKSTHLVSKYLDNDICEAVVCQGLEPLDSWDDLYKFIVELRHYSLDDIVIYTGYTEEEVYNKHYILNNLKMFPNIVIKFGRFIPNQEKHYDEILGVWLTSDNQYAKRIT